MNYPDSRMAPTPGPWGSAPLHSVPDPQGPGAGGCLLPGAGGEAPVPRLLETPEDGVPLSGGCGGRGRGGRIGPGRRGGDTREFGDG